MLMDLFSIFDYWWGSVVWLSFLVVWNSAVIFIILSLKGSGFWYKNNKVESLFEVFISNFVKDLAGMEVEKMGGGVGFFVSLFLMMMLMNVTGMIPLFYCLTSYHFVTFSLAIPLWLTSVLVHWHSEWRVMVGSNFVLVDDHWFISGLSFFVFWVEIFSNVSRALTLGFRLGVNVLMGHMMMVWVEKLACSAICNFSYASIISTLLNIFLVFFLFCVELYFSIIQAVIFWTLVVLYMNDNHEGFSSFEMSKVKVNVK
uniref:ATP synthase F0 subunit 6 n=1 Tax=Musculium lacustre TaxID=98299 RepID=UPI002238E65A|nr:ATP synthase F0 subunit 6 [Musculium lacustre]UYR45708.1 ATP synthase F0 subunit 6 [Musculium lacustre]UYR45721.1 ATP synthase F0 subunit 6 [Musculium lacustre]